MRSALFCLGYLTRLAWRADRRRLLVGAFLLLCGAVTTPAAAIFLKYMIDSILGHDGAAAVRWAAAAAVALIGELMLGHFAHLSYFELSEIVEEHLHRDLLRVVNGSRGLDQCDDPAFADAVGLLRQEIAQMGLTVQSGMRLVAVAVQILLTAVVLAALAPWLLLLPTLAVAPVMLGRWAERLLDAARAETAPLLRAIRHVRVLASSPSSHKEIQLCGNAGYLVAHQDALLSRYQDRMDAAHVRSAGVHATGQLLFGLGYVASVLFAYLLATRGEATIGDIILVLTLATQTSTQVAAGLEMLAGVHRSAAGLRRLEQLRAQAGTGDTEPEPAMVEDTRLRTGITLDRLSFTYPGSDRLVLRDVDLRLPAGCSVALVGENGAGKSTLIKLLVGLYTPTAGRLLVDGADLSQVGAQDWRARTATLFQDFARIELSAQESIGIGHLADVGSADAVRAALSRANAQSLLTRVGDDLGTVLGGGYADGAELSGGQWQSVAFARAMMRTRPMLVALDEPGHALDPLSEQRMLDAYATVVREVSVETGGVTVFVTHRMSTVRLADLIVVLHEGAVVETGTHDELIVAGGRYAELFALQSRAYAT
jgi:ATP-binding cassette, subfamily B, bacterial